MKNITVSVDDESYRRARVQAAHCGRSVSSLVKGYLLGLGAGESDFERLKREEHELRVEMDAKGLGLRTIERMSRDEVYEDMLAHRGPK